MHAPKNSRFVLQFLLFLLLVPLQFALKPQFKASEVYSGTEMCGFSLDMGLQVCSRTYALETANKLRGGTVV